MGQEPPLGPPPAPPREGRRDSLEPPKKLNAPNPKEKNNNKKITIMKHKSMRNKVFKPFFTVGLMLGAAFTFNACDDDLPEGQPSWLGNSIYERLAEEGNYETTLKLIDDLGQTEVLRHTGSKTLFVADDDAYAAWFANNKWGVECYDSLKTSQKKLLLNSSMINNTYLIELMSNVSGVDGNPPQPGLCMRRNTALSIYDTVYTIKPENMPNTEFWDRHRGKENGIVLFKDGTPQPMIHFLPAFMRRNKITDDDLNKLTNGEAQSANEAWINGKKVIERDITCKNGYIHKVDGVVETSPNMAEIIRTTPEMSEWSKLLDLFSAPYYNANITKEYNRLYNNEDSVFELRYFSQGRQLVNPDGYRAPATLLFDPGWNNYMYSNTMGYDMHYDAGAMIVPTNTAIEEWKAQDGKVLMDEYGSLENVPMLTLSKLLNVNMIETMVDKGVPSKFGNIVDDAKLQLGKTKDKKAFNYDDHVVRSYMGCNGVVYLVNRVFPPREFSSVTFPALAHQRLFSSIYWAIDNLEFTPYLNSMDSYYSLILPSNRAMLNYVDPTYYGEPLQRVFRFKYDTENSTLKAELYSAFVDENGNITLDKIQNANVPENLFKDRLEDMVNQMIVIGNVEDGYDYYKTKAGNFIQVKNAGIANQMSFSGAWQQQHSMDIPVDSIYDMTLTGNGKAYMVDTIMPLGSTKSVYNVLSAEPEFSEFLGLVIGGDPDSVATNLMAKKLGTKYTCPNMDNNNNFTLFDNYNYTVYVPTNNSIRELIDNGYLPTWEEFEKQDSIAKASEDADERAKAEIAQYIIKQRITDFVRYHVQDNSVAVNGAPATDVQGNYLLDNEYETMKLNPENKRYFSLKVSQSGPHAANGAFINIEDVMGNKRRVVTDNKNLYNHFCREMWIETSGTTRFIYNSSDAVVHQIDGALFFSADQKTSWRDAVEKAYQAQKK